MLLFCQKTYPYPLIYRNCRYYKKWPQTSQTHCMMTYDEQKWEEKGPKCYFSFDNYICIGYDYIWWKIEISVSKIMIITNYKVGISGLLPSSPSAHLWSETVEISKCAFTLRKYVNCTKICSQIKSYICIIWMNLYDSNLCNCKPIETFICMN